ncbi:MAG: hypothetical protein M0C28_31005 [Candidatus Moduliflexus flocculans]|nr:hypothetical protein [Candidatus Moduliflexus flocculans]
MHIPRADAGCAGDVPPARAGRPGSRRARGCRSRTAATPRRRTCRPVHRPLPPAPPSRGRTSQRQQK